MARSPPQSSQLPDDQDSVLDPIIEDLCRPIKDLSKNFDVNIRENLGKYMDEIHDIVEVNGKKMNFSQAAMMIQGSVGCYGRKVDFLHQYSMKTLNMIGKDGGDGDLAGDGEGGGIRRRRVDGRLGNGDFAFLDIQVDKNTQKKNKESNLDIMMRNLNFIQVTPREFIEKEGLDVGGSKIEIFYGTKYEMLGYKKDFKMNSQFSMATATFGDRLVKEQADTVQRGLDETIVNENYESLIIQHQDNDEVMEDNVDNEMSFHDAAPQHNITYNDDHLDNEDAGNDEVFEEMEPERGNPQEIADRLRDCVLNAVDVNRNRFVQTDAEKAEEMWKSEDLFNDNEDKKPVKKSKIVRLPARIKPNKGKKPVVLDENLPVISMFVQNSIDRFVSKKHPMLSHEIYVEQERRKEYLRMVKKNIKNIQINDALEAEEDEGVGGVDYDDGGADQEDVHHPDAGVDQDDDLEDFEPLPPLQCADPHAGLEGMADADDAHDNMCETNSRTRSQNSYEELVSKMVAEFVQRSQAWIASTDMARKVQSWHKMISPRLQAVEQRAAFDIHEYGTSILGCFPPDQDKQIIGFHQVAKNKPKEEVSRYFLASLMLANCHNIDIGSEGTINDMKISLLSTQRHHEQLHEFQAASQQI